MDSPTSKGRRRSQEQPSPLLSILITTTLLALLYVPRHLLSLLLSPVPISTFLLLTTLLLLGSPPPQSKPAPEPETQTSLPDPHPNPVLPDPVAEWVPRCGPLEVIYEEYEGEEEGDVASKEYPYSCMGVNGFGLSGFCLTDSDEDSSECSSWEEEGLIEIALEEEGLIEIDISSCP